MSLNYPLICEPATPEYVFDLLREAARIDDGCLNLAWDTSVSELVEMLDDLAWPTVPLLAALVNGVTGSEIALDEWHREFPQLRGRTVRDVCDFLAPRTTRPVIRPWRHVTGDCLPAGAFLTVRAVLTGAGVDPAGITPSTPLAPYLDHDSGRTWWRVCRIAPGVVPTWDVEHPQWASRIGCLLCTCAALFVIACGVSWLAGQKPLIPPAFIGAVGCVVAMLVIMSATARTAPTSPGIRTFRDLSYALAGQSPRRRIQPTA